MASRQIKLSKDANELYDTGRGHVSADKIQPLPENLKKKISILLEAIPSKSKSQIAEVLQACDYDVDRALEYFIADGEMEASNEWVVQGKKKNRKKKKSAKKTLGKQAVDGSHCQEETLPENTLLGPKPEEKKGKEQKEIGQILSNGDVENGQHSGEPANKTEDTSKPVVNLKPVVTDHQKLGDMTSTPPLPSPLPVASSPLSPIDSTSSSQNSASFNKTRGGLSANEKHTRVRTASGSEVIKKSHKDLQRSSVSIARYQSMLHEQAESCTKTLAKSFQAIREALNEREKYLEEQLQSVIVEAKKLLEDRQKDASLLNFKCNRVGSMDDEQTTDLRNEIKHFVGERRIDEDLGKTTRFVCEQEKMIETVKSFGKVVPIKNPYTPYKRKHPEPTQSSPQKPPSVKTNTSTASTTSSSKADKSSEARSSNSKNDKRPVLSPSHLKDQAEMHARLQQALKEQQVLPASKEGNKSSERNAFEKPKPKDFGVKTSRPYSSKGPPGNARKEQTTKRQRHLSTSQNSNQNSSKSSSKVNESNMNAENSKSTGDSGPAVEDTEVQDKPEEIMSSQATTARESGDPINHNNRRTKRRYVRKSPPDDGGPIFRTATGEKVNLTKENGNPDEADGQDWSNGQFEFSLVNGTNGFVPLPQRNRRPRKIYCKKDPGSKVEFPPARDNESVPA